MTVKKVVKKGAVEMVKDQMMKKLEKGQASAEKEIAKVKKHLEGAYDKVETYVKKNPEKAALITAAVATAIGVAIAKLVSKPKGKKK